MKDKVTINLRRKPSGEVVGEIVNDKSEGRRIKAFRHNVKGGISESCEANRKGSFGCRCS